MTLIVIIDLFSFLLAILGIISTVYRRKSMRFSSFMFIKIIFLFFYSIYCALLFVDWSNLTHSLNAFEDLSGAILPVLWIIIFYILIEEVKILQIKESENNWKITFQSIGDAIITTDINGKITRMNPSAEKLTGWTLKNAYGIELSDIFRIINAHTGDKVEDPVNKVLKTGNVVELENHTVLINKNHTEYQIADSASPIKDDDGNILGVVLVFSDVTEKYKLQEKINQEQKRFAMVEKGANIGIWDWDVKSGNVLYNENWKTMLGYSVDEIEYDFSEWEKRVHPDELPIILEKLQNHLNGKASTYEIEHRMLTKDNDWKWILSKGEVTKRNSNGEPLRVVGLHFDITNLKQAELVLRENESYLRQIFDTINDAVFLYSYNKDCSKKIEAVNNTACERYGYSRNEFLSLSIDKLIKQDKNLNNYDFGDDGFEHTIYEEYHVTKDGYVFPVEINSSRVNHKGRIMVLAVARDITERKEMELSLINTNEKYLKLNEELEKRVKQRTVELKQTNKDLESFAYSVSHDLRAPIRHIDGFLSLLKKSINLKDKSVQSYFEKIANSSNKMSIMIDELLRLSKVGRAELNFSEVNVADLISELRIQLEPDYNKRNIRWTINSLPKVKGDLSLLKIAFENLLSNAIKYTQKKELAIIEIGEIEAEPNYATIYIKDNGAGFDMKYKDKLFKVFQRLHNKEFDGIGVGLAITNQIITKHKGIIDAKSKINNGAEFYITLPLYST